MLFNEFSNLVFSLPSPVILLEGSRSVEDADKEKLTALGAKLASAFPNIVFRSGNADDADSFFAEDILQVNPKQLELILPSDRKSCVRFRRRQVCLN